MSDGICERCKKDWWAIRNDEIDYKGRKVCSPCYHTIFEFRNNNFQEEINKEQGRKLRDFMMQHPELSEKKLRKNSPLAKELKSMLEIT